MLESVFYREELYQMRENYKKHPLKDIKLGRPIWLDCNDSMCEIYSKKSKLLQQGEIIYACFIQANSILFRAFPPFNCPAHIVYSNDSCFAENPKLLYDIASEIYDYKGQELEEVPDEWKEVARVITDEYDRTDFTISMELNEYSAEYRIVPTMIYRKLLPTRKLCGKIFPVLTVPECKQVLILPKQYWTKKFKQAWVKGII